eukprot:TRINITY_DN26700_c0_g1_i1.p1 TRINITY_DN26700_c0_g1~~TRINITY_DN26700_c0_g1_i1.p1  ORF type:complete len:555 (-),score=96.70 TRINITY_DN26700_c0_g1_i1:201-1865(-)
MFRMFMEIFYDFAMPFQWISRIRLFVNDSLQQYEPCFLVTIPFAVFLFTFFVAKVVQKFVQLVHDNGLRNALFNILMSFVRMLPGVKGYIEEEKAKVVKKLQSSIKSGRESYQMELPKVGLGKEVMDRLNVEKSKDAHWQGRCSGTVYIGGNESEGHFKIINEAYAIFSHTNPLHLDVFPSVARFEAEVVAMTASMLGSKKKSSGGQICGNMTSGGTESILLAVKSSRDYMKFRKGIASPEMIIPESAHSAYDKAAEYFKIKLWRVPVNKDFQADVKAMRHYINKNTIMIVGSAPGFPHGIIDPIEELGNMASHYGICFHVDLCLGGFVLPFARKLGYQIPPFDFTVWGVTSISVDVHKYGLGPKGTSVVLYRNHELRKHQFVAVTEWSGGLYVSPTIAGSRAGGLIAGAWAAMMSVGEEGYSDATSKMMEASKLIQKGIMEIPELFIVGKPDMTVIAFGSERLDIFKVNDVLASRGWHLNALQRPNSVHICLTLQHIQIAEQFLKDLKEAVKTVSENPSAFDNGMAPIYGAAAKMPDRGTVKDLLIEFMDGTC